jgi:peptidoglycan/LPS O-acetylase OafA/YrhL
VGREARSLRLAAPVSLRCHGRIEGVAVPSFDYRVESLRGIAAFAVALTHAVAVFKIDGLPAFWLVPFADQSASARVLTALTTVFNPGAAVILFFVISGYVLTLSFMRHRETAASLIPSYALRRALRLLPAMWVSIAIYVAVISAFRPSTFEAFSPWFGAVFSTPPSSSRTLKSLLLIEFTPNVWTMYVELIGSAAIPLFYYGARRFGLVPALAVLGALALLTVLGSQTGHARLTLVFLVCFCAGSLMAQWPASRIPPLYGVLLGMAIFILERRLLVTFGGWGILADTVGAYLILSAVIQGGRTTAALDHPALRFLGRISYSFYLLHATVIYLVALGVRSLTASDGLATHALLAAVSLSASVVAAWALFHLVEAPATAAGRRLSAAGAARPQAEIAS